MIEQLYTSSPADAPLIKRNLQAGMDIELRRTFELTAVLHVTKLPDGHMQLTVVPINYGRYVFTGTNGGFELQPPPELNVASGWPVVKEDRRETASQAYLDFRTHSGAGPLLAERKQGRKAEANRAQRRGFPRRGRHPDAHARPGGIGLDPGSRGGQGAGGRREENLRPRRSPRRRPRRCSRRRKSPFSRPFPWANRPPLPRVRRRRRARSSRRREPAASTAAFRSSRSWPAPASAPAVPAVAAGGPAPHAWTVYAPGRMPAGKNVRVNEIAALSRGGGLSGEPVYLTGQFVVKALGENKAKGIKNAVMRSGTDPNVRVIVEYPADRALPVEGSEVNRDDQRPYQITDVRQVADGTINVFAREISE